MLQGLLAALLFGAGAPVAKLLVAGVSPLVLAGLLYLGAGLGLSLVPRARGAEAPLVRGDAWLVAGMVLAGGVAGPALMLFGLTRVSGLTGSLLLNLEAPFTMLLAVALFGEHLGRRELAGAALVLLGGAALAWGPGDVAGDALGTGAVAAATLCWALDNNLAGRLSLRDPVAVSRVKALAAGATNLALGLAAGGALPPPRIVAAAAVLGTLSYGASIVLYLRAVRAVGAARQAAYFATAPFAGALLAMPLLGERPTLGAAGAAAVMIAGVAVLARARHHHVHMHQAIEHDHAHVHDEHHAHRHDGPVVEPHAHPHRHDALTHDHPHVSDAHHLHDH